MTFFTFLYGRSSAPLAMIVLWFGLAPFLLWADTDTNDGIPGPGQMALDLSKSVTNAPATNAPAATPATAPIVAPPVSPAETKTPPAVAPPPIESPAPGWLVPTSLIILSSLGGFLLYQCGLTRAKNCAHTSTLLLAGALFALTGYWIGGFALQMGGVGDVHATLPQPLGAADTGALDHELGFNLSGHHLGFMGSSGFFLMTDEPAPGPVALLFLGQAALLIFAVAAALGAALERARLLPMLIYAFLIGVLLYPLLANWVWGGGWLAELGREFGLGHGLVDLAGAGVIHETAGALALAIALVLGPRHGRFAGGKTPGPIPGHHLPFVVLGAIVLLIALTATNAFAAAVSTPESGAATAAVNTLLAAAGGLALSFLHASWKWRKPGPALLSRGMLGGAVASCGGGALLDPWAAFLIGAVAGLLVQAVTAKLERSRVDDPAGTFAVHGAGGAWGLLAVGLFANNTAGDGLNGVPGLVRGLFFGGGARQMAAQLIGCLTGFAVVFVLGYVTLSLIKKIVGLRVDRAEEISGLDWPQLGAFGYQGETEDIS